MDKQFFLSPTCHPYCPTYIPSYIHSKQRDINLLVPLLLFYPQTLGNGCSQCKPRFLLSRFLPIYDEFWHYMNHQRTQTTSSHTSHYHYRNVDFVLLFHNVTCCTNSLLSRIHVHTEKLFNITCTLIAPGVILWSLECTTILPPSPTFPLLGQLNFTYNT